MQYLKKALLVVTQQTYAKKLHDAIHLFVHICLYMSRDNQDVGMVLSCFSVYKTLGSFPYFGAFTHPSMPHHLNDILQNGSEYTVTRCA